MGSHRESTPQVLRRHGAKATFLCNPSAVFKANVIGAGSGYEAYGMHLLRQAVAQGAELGIQAR